MSTDFNEYWDSLCDHGQLRAALSEAWERGREYGRKDGWMRTNFNEYWNSIRNHGQLRDALREAWERGREFADSFNEERTDG